MINMKMTKLIFSLLFLFSIENLHSINYKELKALSNDSVRNLFTTCLDSCRFNCDYDYIIYDIKDKLTKKDFEKKPLTEHEKKRIEFLVSARYEDWELERTVNYKYYKREIDEAIEEDSVLKTLKDTAAIAHREKEIVDFQIAKYKEKRQKEHSICNTDVVRMILKFDWKEFTPLLEDVYKKTMAKECRCTNIDLIAYVLACWHIEPYLSDCIKNYGYDEKEQNVKNYERLEAIGTPAAIYEITKALRSKKKENDGLGNRYHYVRCDYLSILSSKVEGFPYKEKEWIVQYVNFIEDYFGWPSSHLEDYPYGSKEWDEIFEKFIKKIVDKDTENEEMDMKFEDYRYKESEKYIDKIMQWVEENKDNLRFKE